MASGDEHWVTVRHAQHTHSVARRTLYGMIERKVIKSKKIGGILHVLEGEVLEAFEDRAAPCAAQDPNDGGTTTTRHGQAHAGAKQRLEGKRLVARELSVDAEIVRGEESLLNVEASRQARQQEAKLAAEKLQFELERARWEFERERAAADAEDSRRDRALAAERAAAEWQSQRAIEHEEWTRYWCGIYARVARDQLPAGYAAPVLTFVRELLSKLDPSLPHELVGEELDANYRSKFHDAIVAEIDRRLDREESYRSRR